VYKEEKGQKKDGMRNFTIQYRSAVAVFKRKLWNRLARHVACRRQK
jgi:hypothetical protein